MHRILPLSLCLFAALAGSALRADEPRPNPPSATAAPARASTYSPIGAWDWFFGPALTFESKGAVTGARRPAVWFWTDDEKRELQIVWGGPEPGLDKLKFSADGKRLEGSNNDGVPVWGTRLVEVPDDVAPASGAATDVGPVGTWRYQQGPDLTFHDDGTLTGENRTARWSWIDQAKRRVRVDFGGELSGCRDSMTLSEDGKRLRGINNMGIEVSANRLAWPAAASARGESISK